MKIDRKILQLKKVMKTLKKINSIWSPQEVVNNYIFYCDPDNYQVLRQTRKSLRLPAETPYELVNKILCDLLR